MNKIHTLSVDVLRSPLGDCTNGGVSSRWRSLAVYCPDGPSSFDADRETPLNFCMVEKRYLLGTVHARIVPAMVNEHGNVVPRPRWWMKGGNVGNTSDSRFHELSGVYYPLDIHDRCEL